MRFGGLRAALLVTWTVAAAAHPAIPSFNPGADTCGTAVDAGAIPPDFIEPAVLLDPDDFEWRSFEVRSPRSIAVSTFGDPVHSDTNLVLYRACIGGFPSLALDANEDRAADDYTSRMPAAGGRCLEPGTYFVQVGSFLSLGTETEFELRIEDLGSCLLPPRDGFEPDDTPASAGRIGVGRPPAGPGPAVPKGTQRRTIFPLGDLDIARFTLDEPAMVKVRAASPTNADTLMGIARVPDATFIAVNDDESPTSLASRFESCLPAGSWFAVVLARFQRDTFDYELSVEKSTRCTFEREPNDTRVRATALAFRGNRGIIWGVHAAAADADTYRIVVPALRGVVLETSGYDPFDVDTRIELSDARGNVITSDDDGGDGFLSRIERVLPAGTYYVTVAASPFELPLDDIWVYSLSASLGEPPPLELEPNDTCATAQPLASGARLLADLTPAGDRDFYTLTLPASSQGGFDVAIEVRSSGDPVLDVFEDPQECAFRAACDDDSGEGLDPAIHCCFAAGGPYTLQVRDFRDDDPIASYSIEVEIGGECVPTVGCPVAPQQFGCDAKKRD